MYCAKILLLFSDNSCNRVLSVSCGFTFPQEFPEFLRRFTGMYDVPSLRG